MVKMSTNKSNIVKYMQIKSRHKQYIYINLLYLRAMQRSYYRKMSPIIKSNFIHIDHEYDFRNIA